MKYRVLIGFLFAALLLGGCRRERAVSVDELPKLSLTLEIPSAPGTKADEGEVASQMEEENAIYDLKIWVFKHDNHEKVLFAKYPNDEHPNPDDLPQAGTVKKYVFSVDRSLATDNPRPTLDVFVLANSGSINCTLGDVDYTTLTEATFGGSSFFGPESPVTPAILESRKSDSEENRKGLPMSGMGEELKISGEDYSLSIGKITMQRAVSKLRYVFCQTLNIGEDAETMEVLKVELDEDLIPEQEYVFTKNGEISVSEGYVNQKIITAPTAPATYYTVKPSAIPELYTYTGSGASGAADYERLVLGAIKEGKLLNPATYYLRESDKPLTGKVYYQVRKNGGIVPDKNGDDVRCKTFKMETPDFARNHTWTMYGYFISDRTLILSLNVLPWDMNIYNIDFLTSSAMVTVPFTVDPFSVRAIERVGKTDDYKVYMREGAPAKAFLNIVTPSGGTFEVIVKGVDGSDQCFEVTQSSNKINSRVNHGRIDITIDYIKPWVDSYHGKSITLDFKVYTPDENNPQEVALDSEAINQNYIFILP